MPTVNKPRYRQPQLSYWVKLSVDIYAFGKKAASVGEVHKVVQYLEGDGRYARGMPTVRIKGPTGALVGLHNCEFTYCNEQGGEPNEKIDAAV